MSPFARLVDDIAAERDRRLAAREFATMMERIFRRGRPMRGLIGKLEVMTKAMNADLEQIRARKREDTVRKATTQLADINKRATALAASGGLTGEQGDRLDVAIAAAAQRIRAL